MSAVFDMPRVRRDFSRAAEAYDAHADLQWQVLHQAVALLTPHLKRGDTLLDAGCGTGRVLEILPPGGITCIGADAAFSMCDRARRRGLKTACADIVALPFVSSCTDAVLCSLALQWVERRAVAFSELFRVTRGKGYAAVSVFGEGSLSELDAAFRQSGGGARVSRFPTLTLLQKEAESAGWRVTHSATGDYSRTYDSLGALMHSIQAIGAANKRADRARGLTTPRAFQRAEELYRTLFGGADGLHATWRVHYLLLQKP